MLLVPADSHTVTDVLVSVMDWLSLVNPVGVMVIVAVTIVSAVSSQSELPDPFVSGFQSNL
jgi:hypothetical protein